MRSFYQTTCKTDCMQILYKFGKNWISVPNIVHQLTLSLRCNHWKIHNSGDFQDAINSIRRLANGRSEANDVSLLWRHSSWSRLWRLERAYRRPFWRFWGNLNPKMLSAIVWTSKRHFLTSQRVFWAILREILCTGYFSVREKIKIKKRGLIFHVFRQALPYGRLAQILGYVFVSWTKSILQSFMVIG